MGKVRRVDYSPDEMIAGVAGQLDPEEFGVYWMVCTLIYSNGGPIADDATWIARIFRKTNPRTIRAALDRLVEAGKIARSDGELMVKRCRTELELASKRIRKATENGLKGGRPSSKNNDLQKPDGLPDEKLTINHQPSTTKTPFPDGKGESVNDPPGHDPSAETGLPSDDRQPSVPDPQRQDPNDLFGEWWVHVPRKVSRGQAEKAYRAALKHATPTELLDGIQRYAKEVRDSEPRFTKHPATWLNGKCWLDEPALSLEGSTNGNRSPRRPVNPNTPQPDARRAGILAALADELEPDGAGAL